MFFCFVVFLLDCCFLISSRVVVHFLVIFVGVCVV